MESLQNSERCKDVEFRMREETLVRVATEKDDLQGSLSEAKQALSEGATQLDKSRSHVRYPRFLGTLMLINRW